MDREDRQFELILESMIQRCQDLMLAMQNFLGRIEMGQLDYKDYADAFTSYQGIIQNLTKIVRMNSVHLSTRSVFPFKLNPNDDQNLINVTNGRLRSLNHDSAPHYLRTKYEPEIETRFNTFTVKANSINNDQAQKQIQSANKISQNMYDLIRNQREESENDMSRNAVIPTSSSNDTYSLVGALFTGKGLRPGQENLGASKMTGPTMPPQAMAQRPAPGKAGPSIKTNIKAANSMHPYNR